MVPVCPVFPVGFADIGNARIRRGYLARNATDRPASLRYLEGMKRVTKHLAFAAIVVTGAVVTHTYFDIQMESTMT